MLVLIDTSLVGMDSNVLQHQIVVHSSSVRAGFSINKKCLPGALRLGFIENCFRRGWELTWEIDRALEVLALTFLMTVCFTKSNKHLANGI